MDPRRWMVKPVVLLFCMLLLFGLLACEPTRSGPKAWIDEPIDGATVPKGDGVRVISHAFARPGVREVELTVNGDTWERVPIDPPGAPFGKAMHKWVPKNEGTYVLQVIAFDNQGQAAKSDPITVRAAVAVVRAPTFTPTGTPTTWPLPITPFVRPTHTPTPTTMRMLVSPTNTPTPRQPTPTWTLPRAVPPVTLTPTPTTYWRPTDTPTPTRRPTDTPWPPAQISFRVDRAVIEQGQCVTFYWDVEYATAVFFDGQGVVGHGSRQECPGQTRAYTLHVEAPRGGGDQHITIQVVPREPESHEPESRDTTPPPAPVPRVPANGSDVDCRSRVTLVWEPREDPRNMRGYYVKLEVQNTKGKYGPAGEWGPVQGKQLDVNVQCGGMYRWAVRAQDKAGNMSDWSGWSSFGVNID